MNNRKTFRLPSTEARVEAELNDEFQFHIEERIEQFMHQGMSREAAEAEVQRRFGDYHSHLQEAREIDVTTIRQRERAHFARTLISETRRSVRQLLRSPAFTLVAFITLVLGIGATTAIFTVLDAVVLRPLPYHNAHELVSVLHPATVPGSGDRNWGLSHAGYVHFRKQAKTVQDLALYRTTGFIVTTGGDAEVARVATATSSIFPVLRAQPAFGRLTVADDDMPGARDVVVLSYEYFQRRFGGDTSVIGKTLEAAHGNYEIVGVAQPGLTLPMPGPFASTSNLAAFGVDLWVPERVNPDGPFYNNHPFVGIARLASGATAEAAQQEFTALMTEFTTLFPDVYSDRFMKNYNFRVGVSELRNAVLGPQVPRTMWMLFGSVLVVLVIAAANVANLFMVRFEARRRDAAVRRALGADGVHMAAHYLSETMLLSLSGGIVGIAAAGAGIRALLAIAPTNIPRLPEVSFTWRSAGVGMGIAAVLGVLMALLPLLRRTTLAALRDSTRGSSASPRQRAARSTLIVSQVALAVVLLASAGLMLRSFAELRSVRPGFSADNVLVFELSLPFNKYGTRESSMTFHREMQERIRGLPGVTAVGLATGVPMEDFGTGCSVVFKRSIEYVEGEQVPCVATPIALPGFFEALGIRVEGRIPDWQDIDTRTQAVVVTRALADRMWPGGEHFGRNIGSNGRDSEVWYNVAGVIPEVRLEALDRQPTEAVFYAATALRESARDGTLTHLAYFVRTNGVAPVSLIPSIRSLVQERDASVPFLDPRALTDVVERSMARASFTMVLLGIAATVALCLSLVGLYGVISYVVSQRRGEIGVRMALGATVTDVVRLVVSHSVRLTVTGVALGLFLTLWLTRTMEALLYEVSPTDPVVLLTVVVLLLVVGLLASAAPARRAARIDPSEAMRSE